MKVETTNGQAVFFQIDQRATFVGVKHNIDLMTDFELLAVIEYENRHISSVPLLDGAETRSALSTAMFNYLRS